jgi:hypothetical protein
MDSVLKKRTMTIPLYKYLNKEEEIKVISYMKAFSSFKFKWLILKTLNLRIIINIKVKH